MRAGVCINVVSVVCARCTNSAMSMVRTYAASVVVCDSRTRTIEMVVSDIASTIHVAMATGVRIGAVVGVRMIRRALSVCRVVRMVNVSIASSKTYDRGMRVCLGKSCPTDVS